MLLWVFYQDWPLSCFNFCSYTLTSSWVNCHCLMFWWFLIFEIDLFVTTWNFPSRFLKSSFHICIHSSWLAAFSLALEMLLLILTSLTVCHVNWDCLSSTEFLILLIWFWLYSICSFWYALIISLCAFLTFWALTLSGFLLLHRDAVFMWSRFFLTANVSNGTLCLIFSLVCMHSAVAFMWVLTKFSYSSFGVFRKSHKEHRICLYYHTFIVNISIVKRS